MAEKRVISPAKSDYADVIDDSDSVEGVSDVFAKVSVDPVTDIPDDSRAEETTEATLKVPDQASTSRERSKSPPAISNTTLFKLTSQMSRYQHLQFMEQDIKDLVRQPEQITMTLIEDKLSQLNQLWTYFVVEHEALGVGCRLTLFKHQYMTDRVYESALRMHYHMESVLHRVKSELHATEIQKSIDDHRAATQQSTHVVYQQAALPEIKLPTFSGDSSAWTQFRDMFTSLVHDRADLRPVSKLHYLKAHVSGPPAQLIKHAVMNYDGYAPAWKQLKERYDNPELLIFSHIKDLFRISTPSSKSAEQLDNLVGMVKQNLEALKVLKVPVDSANYFLVYLVASKLEQPLRESWELERSRSTSPTTLDRLLNFISTRARAMESAQEAARQAKRWPTPVITRKSRSQTTHPQTTRASRHGAQKRQADYPCDQCNSLDHYLVDCKSFAGLSQAERYKLVLAARLCFNCFGHHSIQVCQSEKRCSTCNQKHHSMIHNPRTESLRRRGYKPGEEPQSTQTAQQPSTSQQ